MWVHGMLVQVGCGWSGCAQDVACVGGGCSSHKFKMQSAEGIGWCLGKDQNMCWGLFSPGCIDHILSGVLGCSLFCFGHISSLVWFVWVVVYVSACRI